MFDQVLPEGKARGGLVLQTFQLLLCGLPIVEPEVVAGLQIEGNGRVREVLKVNSQDLLGHVVIVQLVVAESHVDVQCQILPVVQQYSLVNINSFLVVGPGQQRLEGWRDFKHY